MQRKIWILAVTIFSALTWNSFAADEAMQGAPVGMPQMDEEMMKKMQEFSTPNENHQYLDVFAGDWKYTMRWWMEPDAPPQESDGTMDSKWIMNGRFLQSETMGTAMGQPFKGMGIMGYDNVKKEYSNLWIDNMSTGIMTSTATYDSASKTFEEKGSFSCPMTGKKDMQYRGAWKVIDNDHLVYEMYSKGMDGEGEEFKSMEISYTRK